MTLIRALILLMVMNASPLYADNLHNLLQQGQANIEAGHYHEAIFQLDQAQKIAVQKKETRNRVLITTLKAYIDLQQQSLEIAEKRLVPALEQAKQHGWQNLEARITLYLGQLNYKQGQTEGALKYFNQVITNAQNITEKALVIKAYLHLINVTYLFDSTTKVKSLLTQAELLLKTLPENKTHSKLWMNLAFQSFTIYQKELNNQALERVYQHLNKALSQSKKFQQPRQQATALTYLAQLYQQQQRTLEAIHLTEKGIYMAQQQNAEDILINLEALLATLFHTENKLPQAISAYRRAVKHIQNTRLDIPVSYENGRSSFRETLAPIYLGLADLLLQQSSTTTDSEQQALLKEAQNIIELMKQSELEDFFKSRCEIATTPIDLEKTDPHAAAIYPISFKDRLDIIVQTSTELRRFSRPISAKKLEKTARIYAGHLRNEINFSKAKKNATLLYQWLIQPLDAYLKQQKITTLVYIPDGALRLFPLAAVYDGQKFLIEDYAIVTSPGMSLIESNKTSYDEQQAILFAGVSYPGEVIYNLPDRLLSELLGGMKIDTKAAAKVRDHWLKNNQKRLLTSSDKIKKNQALRELTRNPEISNKIKEGLRISSVETEIKTLSKQNNMPYLLNETFTLENFEKKLTQKPYKILHIASHGFFGATEDENFIMAHDKVLNVKELQKLLALDHFKKHPIDLIILSACQTAEGDDRSPLGISGVAIKAKVHSALGSLWPVDDVATAELMNNFYDGLKNPHLSKAQALRQSQLSLLKQKDFAHPMLWSPFILVGNWK
jgi:CHAT domain-containing protein